MNKSDDVNTLKIIFEEEDDDNVLLWYLLEEKIKGRDPLLRSRKRKSTFNVIVIADTRRSYDLVYDIIIVLRFYVLNADPVRWICRKKIMIKL